MTNTALERSSGYKGAAVAFAGALLGVLVLGMILWVEPTGAQTCPPGEPDCEPPLNSPPVIDANSASIGADEGQEATNGGTYSDPDGGTVTVTKVSGPGTVTQNAQNDATGTWSWSYATTDGPAQSGTVQVRADDGTDTSTASFSLAVNNVPPTATFNAPQASYSGKSFVVSLTDPNDPSPADRAAGFQYAFDCGSGFGAFGSSSIASCPAGSSAVKGRIRDKDGGLSEYTKTVGVTTAPPSYPNGKVAFMSSRDGNSEIYAMNSDGTGQTNLTDDGASDYDPAFSPDGTRIAFTSTRDDPFGEIYAMNANGTDPTRLTNHFGAYDYDPAFSPDGTRLAFSNRSDFSSFNNEVYVMNADGTGTLTNLTNDAESDIDPSWGGAGDTAPPQTTITSGPADRTNGTSAAFEFTSSEPDSVFECSLDGGPFGRCSSPESYPNLAEEDHTFEVRATDVSGNTDASPASHTWTVDLTASEAPTITNPDDGSYNNTGDFTVSGTAEPGARVELFEGAAKKGEDTADASGDWSVELTGVPEGSHSYAAKATDEAGNASASSDERTVIVDKSAPTVESGSLSPADGASRVSRLTNVTATFSEKMDPSTLTASTVTLLDTDTGTTVKHAAVTATENSEGKTVVTLDPFPSNPETKLAKRTRYEVRITTGAKDLAGNALAADKVWSFTTGSK